ncbi:membrane hypothetical protein [Tenacibaculum sp. 190524A02b]|uniref:Uncharacterized protein n=1 Tax=Tenacibaculum vairaonense TaxID=3137860 RepID=A0ABM9PS67_9FLAO
MKKKEVVRVFFIGATFLAIYSLTFLHLNFDKLSEWKPYKEHSKSYKKIISTNIDEENLLLDRLEKGDISIKTYVAKIRKAKSKKSSSLELYHKKKKELKDEYSFLGYSSFRYFLYAIGLPILGLTSSILLLIFILTKNAVNELKRFYLFTSLGFIYVSSFWVLQSFLVKTDFPKWLYNSSYAIVAILSTFIIYTIVYFFSNRNSVIEKLVGLIVSIKNKHYPEVLARVLYAEKKSKNYSLTKTAKELATEFDNEVIETFNSIEK